jgi:hypothetical protein
MISLDVCTRLLISPMTIGHRVAWHSNESRFRLKYHPITVVDLIALLADGKALEGF